jgi:predicted DNA-binding transcriptional regulator AlpA
MAMGTKAATIPEVLQHFDHLPDSAHVDVKVVAALFGKSVNSVWRDAKRGLIPSPVRFGGSTRWQVGGLRRALAAA